MISRKAYAKINLSLDVLGVLPNGYHEVKMIMQTVDLYDDICLEMINISSADSAGRIILSGDIDSEAAGNESLSFGEDNLIYKAAKMMIDRLPEEKINLGVSITLHKHIPLAAGMAGGSTDAAAVLRGMNLLFEMGLSDDELCDIGVKLGADVPYCIMGGTMLAEGIGEKLTPLSPVTDIPLVIAKPAKGISTKYVYENLDKLTNPPHPDVDGMRNAIAEGNIGSVIEKFGNILETVTIPACPEIERIKKQLMDLGAENVLMSGSGPTVFGAFKSYEDAVNAEKKLKEFGGPAIFTAVAMTI